MTRPNKLVVLGNPFQSYSSRARPEPIPLEHLPDASFLGKLLVLPASVRLYWKVIARYKHSSLVGLVISNEEKKSFITLTPGGPRKSHRHGTLHRFDFNCMDLRLYF
jgi:hypothetical protein